MHARVQLFKGVRKGRATDEGLVLMAMVASDNGTLLWPENGDWYGRLEECPYLDQILSKINTEVLNRPMPIQE